jgi:hypothetical protein
MRIKDEKTKFFLPHIYSSQRAVLARGFYSQKRSKRIKNKVYIPCAYGAVDRI